MKKLILQPPVAPKKPQTFTLHGDTRTDDYFWLRDLKDPNTLKYINAENSYFENHMKSLSGLKAKLYNEMRSRIKETDTTVPAPSDDWLYYTRTVAKKQYSIFCRKPKSGGREQVVLDVNQLAKGKKFCHVRNIALSSNHRYLGYAVDFDGSEKYTIHLKDLKTNKIFKESIAGTNGEFEFANDNETLFYVKLDENLRPYQVYYHKLGIDSSNDVLVYQEADSKQFVGLNKPKGSNFIYIESHGKITSEVWLLDAYNPTIPPRCFAAREEGVEYQVSHANDHFWILTNWKAENFRVMKCGLIQTDKKKWEEYVTHSKDNYLTEFLLFKNHLVLLQKNNGLPQVRVHDLASKKEHVVKMQDKAYDVSIGTNYEFDSELLRLNYSSPVQPNSTLEYNMRTKKKRVLKTKIVKGHKPKNYVCERLWVNGHDGAQIPMVLLYKKGIKKNGKNPGYLYAYGSYGISMPDAFWERRDIFRLVDRGFVFALAHIRGGSEMGRSWYENGKFLKKKNTFLDFISCAEFLKNKKYVACDKLAICGGSAGGMLMGGVMNMRPDLFNTVVAHVPFVDVLNTMLDKDLPLTQTEYKEWGNPEDKEYYFYIKSYSPYDNVEEKNYPPLFVTCGLNDPRVTYWEPAKWIAKLRELKTDNHTIVLKTHMGAGHGGSSGRFDHLYETAEEYAFILNQFGMAKGKAIAATE